MTGSERKELHWLDDLKEAIEKIESHPKFGEGLQGLETDEYFRVWVFYHIERIGECASRLRQQFNYDEVHPDIDWKGAVGMRRRLVHQYWRADLAKVWEGVEYLSMMRGKVEAIIDMRKADGPEPVP